MRVNSLDRSADARHDRFMKILLIEDDARLGPLIARLLTAERHTVQLSATGADGITFWESASWDLIILDRMLPDLEGSSILRDRRHAGDTTPVLMLTAFSQKELVDRARDAGVMAYVVKPFTIGDLMPAIEIAISRHLQMKSLAAEVADLHDRLETRKLIDRAKGILMKALNLSEPEAFSWIQRAAMDRRLSMKDVAEAVINPNAVPDK